MRFRTPRFSKLILFACIGVVALPARSNEPARPVAAPPGGGVRLLGFAAPAQKATLAATVDGRIRQRVAEEGEFVRAGQPLVRLDDRVQRARTEMARTSAESVAEVALASVRAEFAQAEVEHVRQLGKTDLASARELRVAESSAATTALEIAQADSQQHESEQNYRLQQILLEEHELRAPFDGFVASILKQPGEVVEAREGILTLVRLDPLEVTLDCPVETWRSARVGETVYVTPADGTSPPRAGVISFANRVADAASQTFKLKVRVPNPEHDWIAGVRVQVDLPPAALPPAQDPALSRAASDREVTP